MTLLHPKALCFGFFSFLKYKGLTIFFFYQFQVSRASILKLLRLFPSTDFDNRSTEAAVLCVRLAQRSPPSYLSLQQALPHWPSHLPHRYKQWCGDFHPHSPLCVWQCICKDKPKIIREMQIRTRVKYHLASTRMAFMWKQQQKMVRMWKCWNPCILLAGM